jgi:cyanate permease
MPAAPVSRLLLLALGAMFLQQTFAALGRNLPSVIAPAILDDLVLDPALVGIYVGIASAASLFFQLSCGGFIIRWGAMRMSQLALVMLAIGLFAASTGNLWLLAFSAIIGGGGAAVSTPASSHLLGRYAPPRQAPLVFSIKQTAVPAGLLVAGLLGPLLNAWVGWRAALDIAAIACLLFAFALQPLRAGFDSDRVPSRSFRISDLWSSAILVTTDRELRNLAFACFAFNGLQSVLLAYFIIYLVSLGHSLATAGIVFSIAMMVAVPARILWGWLGSYHVAPRIVMGGLALGMAGSSAMLGVSGPGWPLVMLGAGGVFMALSALSWHGVLLAETARLAPEGQRGTATGGVLSFGQIGALALPLSYALMLSLTGVHAFGFLVCGVPALVVGIALLRGGRRPGEVS